MFDYDPPHEHMHTDTHYLIQSMHQSKTIWGQEEEKDNSVLTNNFSANGTKPLEMA